MIKEIKEPFAGLKTIPSVPVVLVTVDSNVMTAAAFSFYSFKPPSVMVGIRPQTYTFELLANAKDYGVNIPTVDQLELVQLVGSISGRDLDKFKEARLTPMKSKRIKSVLVKECPVNLECRIVHQIQYSGSHTWFIGEILIAHIDEQYSRDDALMYWLREYRRVGDLIFKITD